MFKIPLGWMQLRHQKLRLLVALSGIAFAVVLILMQLGFRSSLFESAVRYQQKLNYDLAIFSTESPYIVQPRSFSSRRLYQVLSMKGVTSVSPLYASQATWKNPENNEFRSIFVVGIDPEDQVLDVPGVSANHEHIRRRDVVLFDALSRPEYGPVPELIRTQGPFSVELNDRAVVIGGLFEMGPSFGIDGAILTSDTNFLRIFPQRPRTQIDLGLVLLEPGTDLHAMQAQLQEVLPDDVMVLTRAEFKARERAYWDSTTPIGYVFAFGVVIGFLVGAIIVYQILFADVSDHLPEYATLKAIGYSNRFVSGVVIQQAVILAVLGFVPGIAVAFWLYRVAGAATQLPMYITPERALSVLGLTIVMCALSGLMALRRVRAADPADIF